MNLKKISKYLIIATLAAFTFSCQDMDDFHQQYIQDGETIYTNKMDSILTYAGNGRIKINGILNSAPNVSKVWIFWDNKEDSISFDYEQVYDVDTLNLIVPNLEERSYDFEIYTRDSDGNRSIRVQAFGTAYGSKYQASLLNRGVSKIEGGGITDTMAIVWLPGNVGDVGVELTYNNSAGQSVTTFCNENPIVIRNWESLGTLSYKTYYIPEPTAIDTFVTEATEIALPEIIPFDAVKIDNADWEIIDFSTEEAGGEGPVNGYATAVIDGDLGTFWHSNWATTGSSYPHYLTIDMNQIVKIGSIESYRRRNDGRGHTKYEIQTSMNGTTFVSQGTYTFDSGSNDAQVAQLANLPEARFIKYIALEGPQTFTNLAEISVSGVLISKKFSQSEWQIIDFSSEEAGGEGPVNGYVTAAIDNDISTFWHTTWSTASPDYPHYFTVDMGAEKTIKSFECYRRQGNSGGHTKVQFHVSTDGVNWTDVGTFDNDRTTNDAQIFILDEPTVGRYFKFTALEGPNNFTFLGEIYVHGTD